MAGASVPEAPKTAALECRSVARALFLVGLRSSCFCMIPLHEASAWQFCTMLLHDTSAWHFTAVQVCAQHACPIQRSKHIWQSTCAEMSCTHKELCFPTLRAHANFYCSFQRMCLLQIEVLSETVRHHLVIVRHACWCQLHWMCSLCINLLKFIHKLKCSTDTGRDKGIDQAEHIHS